MVNLEFFNKFAKPIIFLNTSRGEIVPLADLKAVVEDKKVKMAALDVLECEKLDKMTAKQAAAFSWLKDSGKVIFTPHVAGWTVESYRRINVVLVEKIAAFLDHG
jgi:D-3-phosphoglycerate dehydrogenase / 2-oxoglutarate reductase